MSYLLDTNVLSELRKGTRCDHGVSEWFAKVAEDELYLSVLVLGEVRRGIERLRHRDPAQASALEGWLRTVSSAFVERILPVDRLVAETWGAMGAARPLPTVDGLLAATAKVHGLTLVTRNTTDVEGTGASVLNPWSRVAAG